MGTIHFQADEDLQHAIVNGLRRRSPLIDIQTAVEAGLRGLPDPEVLAYAAACDHIIVTSDFKTLPVHFGAFLLGGQHSPGRLMVSQAMSSGAAIDELLLIWGASEPDDWRDQITYLPL